MTKAQEKARALRYKKAALSNLNLCDIQDGLAEIAEECDNVRWMVEQEDDTLLNALDGDEDEEFEFKMMFSDLSAECEQLDEMLYDGYVTEYFDVFFVGIMCRNRNPFQVIGYDSYEEDYFNLLQYETDWAENEAYKRLMRLTKNEIISTAGQCFGVAMSFFNIERKYDYLKAAFDVLRDKNTSFLQILRDIDAAYEKAEDSGDWREFDNIAAALPDKTWIE